MKRSLILVLICSAATPLCAQETARAENGQPDSLRLTPTVITATRAEEPINHLPAGMTVISRVEIEQSGADHVVDLLQARGGVQVSDTFGDGSRTLIGLRGFGENAHSNTLILIDGRPLNNPDIGAPELNAVSLKDVERIEILQGSAGVLYGDQAVGGVINIVTRGPLRSGETQRGSIRVAGGSYESQRIAGAYALRLGNGVGLRLSVEDRKSDNYRDHNDLDYENLLARFDWQFAAGNLFVELQGVEEELETPGALFEQQVEADRQQADPSFRGDFTNTDTGVWRIGGGYDIGEHWEFASELTRRRSRSRFRLSFFGAPETRDAFQHREIYSFSPRLIGRLPTAHGDALLTIGADAGKGEYELQSRFGTQTNDQQTRAGYVQAILPVASLWTVTGGARVARVENDLQDNSPFPVFDVYPQGRRFHETETATELGIEYQPTSHIRAFARIDRNFRFAKLDEYFSSGATPGSGQVVLDTQTGESIEVGGGWYGEEGRFELTVYELDLEDEIAFDPVSFRNINLDATQRTGAIVETGWWLLPWLAVDGGLHVLDAQIRRGRFSGNDIPLVAEQTAHAGVDINPCDGLQFRLEARHVGARGFSGDFNETLGSLDSFTVVNLASRWTWRGFSVGARVNNLLDEEYSEFGAKRTQFLPPTFAPQDFETFFPSPERNFWLELGYEFGI